MAPSTVGTPQVGSPPNELALTTNSDRCYYPIVIRSYRDKDTRAVAERRRVRGLPEDIQRRAQRKLMILNNATNLNDLRIPPGTGWRLCRVTAMSSTAFASTTSGGSASSGVTATLTKSK